MLDELSCGLLILCTLKVEDDVTGMGHDVEKTHPISELPYSGRLP
jgi:hypothetical protein